jgi:hypothetical protein
MSQPRLASIELVNYFILVEDGQGRIKVRTCERLEEAKTLRASIHHPTRLALGLSDGELQPVKLPVNTPGFECVLHDFEVVHHVSNQSLGEHEIRYYQSKNNGLAVIASVGLESDGQRWLHVSLSRKSRLPSYDDITLVKRLFVGKDRKAIMILPAENEHINIHPYCLHLWSPLEKDYLPDFRRVIYGTDLDGLAAI